MLSSTVVYCDSVAECARAHALRMHYPLTIPDIRLVGGSGPHEGRVEVYHNSVWGTVCDGDWDLQDAMVVCRQLGYGTAVSALGFAAFGWGSGQIWYDDVRCSGHEANLTQCGHRGLGVHNCGHREDAGVICTSKYLPVVCHN